MLAWLNALEDAYLDGTPCTVFASELLEAGLTLRGDAASFIARWPSARSVRALEELAEEVLRLAEESNCGRTTRAAGLTPQRETLEATFTRALAAGGARTDLIASARDALGFPPFSG